MTDLTPEEIAFAESEAEAFVDPFEPVAASQPATGQQNAGKWPSRNGLQPQNHKDVLEQVPPHDAVAESCVIGSMLMRPEAADMAVTELKPRDFYVPRHRLLFSELCSIWAEHKNLDEVFVAHLLEKRGKLDAIGGRDAIGDIQKNVSPASIEGYCHVVKERALERGLVEAAGKILALVHEPSATGGTDLLARARGCLLEAEGIAPATAKIIRLDELLAYDTANDPNALVGKDRWLCRGGSVLFGSHTGAGKSSFELQFHVPWTLGLPCFGIGPIDDRPLRILVIQAENDTGDLAEFAQGVLNGLGLSDRIKEMSENMLFVRERSLKGEPLVRFAASLIKQFKCDICVLDPWQKYLGADVKDHAKTTDMCSWLEAVSEETGVAWWINHHDPKPSRKNDSAPLIGGNRAYQTSGTHALPDHVRAVVGLEAQGDGVFKLVFSKRGRRAGLTVNDEGHLAQGSEPHIFIKHAATGIFWERADEPVSPKMLAARLKVEEILSRFPAFGATYQNAIEIVMAHRGCEKSAAKMFFSRAVQPHCVYNPALHVYTIKPISGYDPL